MAVDIVAALRLSISEFQAKMAEAQTSFDKLEAKGASSMEKMSAIGKGALLGLGASAVVVGAAAVDFGDKLEASQASLQAALKASGTSWSSVQRSVSAAGQGAQRFGFTQAQVDAALAAGVISTQNYGLAHRNLGVAIQLAAARHIDLASAMQLVDRAATGQTRPLKQLGIDLPIVASNALKVKQAHEALQAAQLSALSVLRQYPDALNSASKHHAAYQTAIDKVMIAQGKVKDVQAAGGQIIDALSRRLSGQASAAANTFAGRVAAMKAQGENLAAQLGLRLIPVLERLMSIVMRVVDWFEHHKAAAIALAAVIGGVLVAAMAASAVEFFAAFGWVEVVALAIAALVAGIVLLATHWHQVWTDIKNWINDAAQFIRDHFYMIMAIPIVGWILVLAANWRTVFEDVKAVIQGAWSVIGPIFNLIKTLGIDYITTGIAILQTVWNTAWGVVSSALSAAWSVIGPIFGFIKTLGIDVITGAINGLQTAWNTVWGAITAAVQGAWSVIKPIFDGITGFLHFLGIGGGGGLNATPAALNVQQVVTQVTGQVQPGQSNAPGHPHAVGGPVSAFTPYLVGERGPEMFIPSASGSIVPNTGGVGAAGGGLTVQFQLDGQTLYQKTWPSLMAVLLQNKRSWVTLGLS
jgi:hypothetical protein